MSFADARKVADAVLYEGYILYPYRASSRKNRFRFQFGVLVPRAYASAGSEAASLAIEVPVEGEDVAIAGKLRFLQLRRRTVERCEGQRSEGAAFAECDGLDVEGRMLLPWDEAIEREIDFAVPRGDRAELRFALQSETALEDVRDRSGACIGRVVRTSGALSGVIRVESRPSGDALWTVRVDVENTTPHDDPAHDRDRALRASLLGAHVLLSVERGAFVSVLEPPAHAEAAAAACKSSGAFPVLVGRHGDRSTVLGSPIILYDWPAIAPESQGDFFDATEMDEMLVLRTMTLTDEEKREARATDLRAAAIVDRADATSPDGMERLHGAVRSLRVGRTKVARGTRVRLRLGRRRSDAQDMFVDGKLATVEDVREDFEGNGWLAVIVDDDPAAEMNRWYGRHLWFHPDEIEVLETSETRDRTDTSDTTDTRQVPS